MEIHAPGHDKGTQVAGTLPAIRAQLLLWEPLEEQKHKGRHVSYIWHTKLELKTLCAVGPASRRIGLLQWSKTLHPVVMSGRIAYTPKSYHRKGRLNWDVYIR